MKHMIFIRPKYLECYFPSLKNPNILSIWSYWFYLVSKITKFKPTAISRNTRAFDELTPQFRNSFTRTVHLQPNPRSEGPRATAASQTPGKSGTAAGCGNQRGAGAAGAAPGSLSEPAALPSPAPRRPGGAGRETPARDSARDSRLLAGSPQPQNPPATRAAFCRRKLRPPASLPPRQHRGCSAACAANPPAEPVPRSGAAGPDTQRCAPPPRAPQRLRAAGGGGTWRCCGHVTPRAARAPPLGAAPPPPCASAGTRRGLARPPGAAASRPRPAPRRRRRRRRRPAGHEAPPAP